MFAEINKIDSDICQGGERTSQSRDQNIEIEYKLGNFVSLRTGKNVFFKLLVVPLRTIASAKYGNNFMLFILHAKLFNISQVL